jgi:hypothetical protein
MVDPSQSALKEDELKLRQQELELELERQGFPSNSRSMASQVL